MKRNLTLLSLIIAFNLLFWLGRLTVFAKPDEIYDLEFDQKKINEKYITAQILSQELDEVYNIFENNLAFGKKDKLNEEASMIFLKEILCYFLLQQYLYF